MHVPFNVHCGNKNKDSATPLLQTKKWWFK